jgi:CheY-like chemotaxis protein
VPFLKRTLEEAGATVSLAATPDDALARVATASCDLLIVDGALGAEAAREVAQEARRAGVAKSLVLLSPFERRAIGSPTEAGFDGSLIKPLPARALFERLSEDAPPRPSTAPAPGSVAAPAAPSLASAAAAAPRRPGRGAPRVLLAEDNEINALLAVKSLEKLGAMVDWARDGQEALALAEASLSGAQPAYDLVLMDIRMPGLDGNETTRRIRLLEKTLRREEPTRIIALTARAMKNDREAAQAAGFDGFLPKPYRSDALRDLLAEVQPSIARAS